MPAMHIFLTGGTGFIGKNMVPYLLGHGCRLSCLVRDPGRLPQELAAGVSVITGDLEKLPAGIDEVINSVDAVVHLAGNIRGPGFEDYRRVNEGGTRNLVNVVNRAAGHRFKRFVHLSSVAATGPSPLGHPISEEADPHPVSWYGQTKLAGEKTLEQGHFPWTILRPPVVYGPYDKDVFRFFKMIHRHIRPVLTGFRVELSLIHVLDVCQSAWLTLTRESKVESLYFINDGTAVKDIGTVFRAIASALDNWTIPLPIPVGLLPFTRVMLRLMNALGVDTGIVNPDKLREAEQQAWTCRADSIVQQLGYQPEMDLSSGLSQTVAWYRQHGWL